MSNAQKKPIQSRVFTASLKPAWSKDYAQEFADLNKGVVEVYVVNHDKDINEQGEVAETHTHIVLIYTTPRKVSTIANLLNVPANFVEIVSNKVAMLRYLTHKDQPLKSQYADDEVITNSTPYADVVAGASMSDKEIIEMVLNGREFELIGAVSMTKIRLAQSLVHNKRLTNAESNLAILRESNLKLQALVEQMAGSLANIDNYFTQLVTQLTSVGVKAQEGIVKIAEEIKKARLKVR